MKPVFGGVFIFVLAAGQLDASDIRGLQDEGEQSASASATASASFTLPFGLSLVGAPVISTNVATGSGCTPASASSDSISIFLGSCSVSVCCSGIQKAVGTTSIAGYYTLMNILPSTFVFDLPGTLLNSLSASSAWQGYAAATDSFELLAHTISLSHTVRSWGPPSVSGPVKYTLPDIIVGNMFTIPSGGSVLLDFSGAVSVIARIPEPNAFTLVGIVALCWCCRHYRACQRRRA
jgi:hypothetical protein